MNRRIMLAALSCVVALLALAIPALALERKELECIPSAVEQPVKSTNASGTCPSGYSIAHVLGGPAAEHLTYVAEGVDKKPTWEVKNANLKIIRVGSEEATKHTGNLIVGSGLSAAGETSLGEDNVIVGSGNEASSFWSLVVGASNKSQSDAQFVAGEHNVATAAPGASILGGTENIAAGAQSSICGGSGVATGELLQNLC